MHECTQELLNMTLNAVNKPIYRHSDQASIYR